MKEEDKIYLYNTIILKESQLSEEKNLISKEDIKERIKNIDGLIEFLKFLKIIN